MATSRAISSAGAGLQISTLKDVAEPDRDIGDAIEAAEIEAAFGMDGHAVDWNAHDPGVGGIDDFLAGSETGQRQLDRRWAGVRAADARRFIRLQIKVANGNRAVPLVQGGIGLEGHNGFGIGFRETVTNRIDCAAQFIAEYLGRHVQSLQCSGGDSQSPMNVLRNRAAILLFLINKYKLVGVGIYCSRCSP